MNIDIDLDVDGMRRDVSKLDKETDRVTANIKARFESVSSSASNFGRAVAAISPVFSTFGAVAVGAVGGLASAFTAAGVAAGAFGAVVATNLKGAFEASEELTKINEEMAKAQAAGDMKKVNDLMKERAALMKTLDKDQRRAVESLQEFKAFWSDFAGSFQSQTVTLFTGALDNLQTVITRLKPAVTAAFEAFSNLQKGFTQWLNTKEAETFFNWLGTQAGPAIQNFGAAFGNIFRGVMNLMVAFTPLSNQMQTGLVGLSEKFLRWTQSLQNSQSFQAFVSYVQTNGPKIVQIIGQLGQILGQLAVIMAPIGAQILDLTLKFLQWLNSLLQTHPQLAAFLIVGFQLAKIGGIIASGITGAINVFTRLKTVFTSIGPVATKVASGFAKVGKGGLSLAKTIGSITGKIITFIGRLAVQFLVNAARIAASWVIAMGPVGWVVAIVVGLVALIIANWDKVKAWTIKAWNAISKAISQAWTKIKSWASKGISSVRDAISRGIGRIKSLASRFYSAGRDLINGLVKGIKAFAKRAVDAAVNAAKDAVGAVKKWLGISSPAKMTIDMGRDFAVGFAIGIESMMARAERASRAMAGQAVGGISTQEPAATNGPTIHMVINGGDRETIKRARREARRMLRAYGY